jgi:hypothetical protein
MLVMRKEFVADMKDLKFLSLACGECGTTVIVDLDGKTDIAACPACHETFDAASIGSHISALSIAYKYCVKAKHKISFRVPVTD